MPGSTSFHSMITSVDEWNFFVKKAIGFVKRIAAFMENVFALVVIVAAFFKKAGAS